MKKTKISLVKLRSLRNLSKDKNKYRVMKTNGRKIKNMEKRITETKNKEDIGRIRRETNGITKRTEMIIRDMKQNNRSKRTSDNLANNGIKMIDGTEGANGKNKNLTNGTSPKETTIGKMPTSNKQKLMTKRKEGIKEDGKNRRNGENKEIITRTGERRTNKEDGRERTKEEKNGGMRDKNNRKINYDPYKIN